MVNLTTPQGNIISRKYDWHNAKYHINSREDLNRDHDEKRLYRSKSLDKDLDLEVEIGQEAPPTPPPTRAKKTRKKKTD